MSHPTNSADSAGQPWAGRSFKPNQRTADDGSAPPALMHALESFRAGTDDGRLVVDEFRSARLLIPLIAHAGDVGVADDGRVVDKTQELSIITVSGPDGRDVMPVFSSVATMRSWNPTARPVPAEGIRVALAAAEEKTDLVVLDPTSPTEFVVRRPALWAIAQEKPWVPSFADQSVIDAVEASVRDEPAVAGVGVEPGDPASRLAGPECVVRLELRPGLTREQLNELLQRLSVRWGGDATIAERVDSITARVVASRDL